MPDTFRGRLISSGLNRKTIKSDNIQGEYATAIMHLAPHTLAGGKTVCSMAVKAGCAETCLNTAGKGLFPGVQQARIRKTRMLQDQPNRFFSLLHSDLYDFTYWCRERGRMPAVRLNGTSDIRWEHRRSDLFEEFSHIQFYDYTKIPERLVRTKHIPNYALTLSYSEADQAYATSVKAAVLTWRNVNVAIVYRNVAALTAARMAGEPRFPGWQVIDGTAHDLRFLDPSPCVVGLIALGNAKNDTTGFVIG